MKLRTKTEGVDAVDRALALLYDAPEVEIRPEERERQLREMRNGVVINCKNCGNGTKGGECKALCPSAAWDCRVNDFKSWRGKRS